MSRCTCPRCTAPHPPCPTCPSGASWHTPFTDWWRFEVSLVGHGVYVGGAPTPATLDHAAGLWADLGVAVVLDLTEYGVLETDPASSLGLERHWLRMEDPCPAPPAGLFTEAIERAGDRRVLVHCHQGVNRAPSVALRLLIARGVEPVAALRAVAVRRPIAGLRYARHALADTLGCDLADPRVLAFEAERAALVATHRGRLLADWS